MPPSLQFFKFREDKSGRNGTMKKKLRRTEICRSINYVCGQPQISFELSEIACHIFEFIGFIIKRPNTLCIVTGIRDRPKTDLSWNPQIASFL